MKKVITSFCLIITFFLFPSCSNSIDEDLVDTKFLDSCDKIIVYNYANVEITDKHALILICEAIKKASIEKTESGSLSKGAIKITVFCGDESEKIFLCDDLIFIGDKVYRDSSKSIISAVKDYSDKYIIDSKFLDSCDKIVVSDGTMFSAEVTENREISGICDAVKNADLKLIDVGQGTEKYGGLSARFFCGNQSDGFQVGEEININDKIFFDETGSLVNIFTQYYLKYKK